VYFGAVDQQSDEHRLVRGMTLSPHHNDSHYCLGSVDGYDVTFVERSAIIPKNKYGARSHVWHVMVVDLHVPRDIPHVFIGSRERNELLYSQLLSISPSFRQMPPVSLPHHSAAFMQHYAIYATPTQYLEVDRLLTPDATQVLATHFHPFAIEITNECVYIYADQQHLTSHVLEKMLKDGLWLAKYIDTRQE
jgi:hypothetical protein